MSVKYRELDFKDEEEREKGIRYVMENAESSLPKTRVVRIGRANYRVSIHLLKGQYYLVYEPKGEILLPRVWLVTIPGFGLCEIPIGEEMLVCGKRVTGVFVGDGELAYVCDYHGSGFKVMRSVFDRQLKPVPQALCVRYCPQAIRARTRIVITKKVKRKMVEGEHLKVKELRELEKVRGEEEKVEEEIVQVLEEMPVYECRAFMPYANEREEIKRRRPYRGMFMLCLDDYWWRRYLRRIEEVE